MTTLKLVFPSFGISEIIASFEEGGILFSFRTQLYVSSNLGTNCSRRDLYHSALKPSRPADLFAFNLEMAAFNSSVVISYANRSFCSSEIEDKSSEAKNASM